MHNKFFSGVLTVLSFIVKIPLFGIRYFCIGLFFTMYYILSFLIEIVSYFGKGVLVVSLILKQIFFLTISFYHRPPYFFRAFAARVETIVTLRFFGVNSLLLLRQKLKQTAKIAAYAVFNPVFYIATA